MIRFLILTSVVTLGACSQGRQSAAQAEASAGAVLWGKYCALCHGAEGQGYAADNAPALANQEALRSVDDVYLYSAVEMGRPGTPMAPYGARFGGPLSEEDINVLVRYIRGWQRSSSLPREAVSVSGIDPELGRKLYETSCSACHGADGSGVTAPSLGNPVFLTSVTNFALRHAIRRGRPGTPMQAYSDLTATEVLQLIAYIRSFIVDNGVRLEESNQPTLPDDLVANPAGSSPDFGPLGEGRYLSAERLRGAIERKDRMVLLDARSTADYVLGHLPGAVPAPYYDDFDTLIARLPKDDTWIVAYCGCPHHASDEVVDRLRDAGFKNTAVLDEGVFYWADLGYPLVTGTEPIRVEKRDEAGKAK